MKEIQLKTHFRLPHSVLCLVLAAGIPYGVYLQMPLIVVCCTIPLFLILRVFLYQSPTNRGY